MTTRFYHAARLSRTAQELDDEVDKTALPDDLRQQLQACIELMHDTAQALAGEHVHELYASEEQAEQVRKRYAATLQPQPEGAAA